MLVVVVVVVVVLVVVVATQPVIAVSQSRVPSRGGGRQMQFVQNWESICTQRLIESQSHRHRPPQGPGVVEVVEVVLVHGLTVVVVGQCQ